MEYLPKPKTEAAPEKFSLEYTPLLRADPKAYKLDLNGTVACSSCKQINVGQTGVAPCSECGLPTGWDQAPYYLALEEVLRLRQQVVMLNDRLDKLVEDYETLNDDYESLNDELDRAQLVADNAR
jgi:ribosomal protein L37AE/L43A